MADGSGGYVHQRYAFFQMFSLRAGHSSRHLAREWGHILLAAAFSSTLVKEIVSM